LVYSYNEQEQTTDICNNLNQKTSCWENEARHRRVYTVW
jgi:hypothetical protein